MNQKLKAQGAMKTQQYERYGESLRQSKEEGRLETIYGMDMGRVTAANEARQKARENMLSGVGAGIGTIAGGVTVGDDGNWIFG